MASQTPIGLVTVQVRFLSKGVLFKENSQYPFVGTRLIKTGCGGCNGKPKENVKYYDIIRDDVVYIVDQKYLVETDVEIPEKSQDFDVARRDQHRNAGIDNYDSIRTNNDPDLIWAEAQRAGLDNFKH
ncbi:MAG: hypothetical protein V3R32_03995 [Nitrosomonadaceae bacterium]